MPHITGKGTVFRRFNTATGAYEALAQILSITGPGMTRDTVDTTALDTAGGYRTFIAGFRNPGTMRLSMSFSRDEYETLKTDFESDVEKNYEMILPDDDNTSLEFAGLVTELPLTVPPDALVVAEVVIQISGEVTLESGSGPSPGA